MKNPGRFISPLLVRQRRPSREVMVGHIGVGGSNPIRVQSMITCDTMDTEASIQQTIELAEVGCEIVRITAPTVKDAANLQQIVRGLRERGCNVPIVADIHFKPEAAMEAAKWVDKVRINPGNYADSKKFKIIEYTDEQYAAELARIRERFSPLVRLCHERNIAIRIGTNHGSLSDRIMNRYGDTPLGMVESALEFARIARELNYHALIFSMKSSNPKVMIAAYRLLIARLEEEGPDWNYPIHLGVTEAGEGEDARIKSAIGIGSLLNDGIGDTIRVSLTEDSVHEIPVARALVDCVAIDENVGADLPNELENPVWSYDPFAYQRRATEMIAAGDVRVGGEETVRVAIREEAFAKIAHKVERMGDYKPEFVYEQSGVREIDPRDDAAVQEINRLTSPSLVTVRDRLNLPVIAAFRLLAAKLEPRHPILLKDRLTISQDPAADFLPTLLRAATNIGALLCDGIGDTVLVQGEHGPGQALRLSYNILQAAGARIFKTDYVACPSCGRTLFNLQITTAKIKAATAHLKGVKIAIMGCIVNGPGEMADADFGYVGGAPGKVNLYVGKTAVKFNIPEAEAVGRLQELIREHGKWIEPAEAASAVPA
ncbi:MAG TPA: (E)-4-hydroxy-3-methylbut-2-enyl-diphosphate synthase [Chthoniobacterales bacterium]|nr:(E)-4-hydroxy-3-methylbut-2-enyl-diphosphate synthase [Chthoniobacterales bacterium]